MTNKTLRCPEGHDYVILPDMIASQDGDYRFRGIRLAFMKGERFNIGGIDLIVSKNVYWRDRQPDGNFKVPMHRGE